MLLLIMNLKPILYKKVISDTFVDFYAFTNKACPQSKYTLLLAHDLLGNHEDYQFLIDALSDKFNIITMDLLGHGRSANMTKYGYEAYLSHASDLVNLSKNRDIIWIGNGFGAVLGAHLASMPHSPIFGLVSFNSMKYNSPFNDDMHKSYVKFNYAKAAFKGAYPCLPDNIVDQLSLNKYRICDSNFVPNYDLKILDNWENLFSFDLKTIWSTVKCNTLMLENIDLIKEYALNTNTFIHENITKTESFIYKDEHINRIHEWINSIVNNPTKYFDRFKSEKTVS